MYILLLLKYLAYTSAFEIFMPNGIIPALILYPIMYLHDYLLDNTIFVMFTLSVLIVSSQI